jgi:hypothetical protein
VVCRSHFRPDGGYVCFGGVLVLWAASAVRAQPGDVLTVVGVDQQTGQLRVDVAASHQPPYAEEIR